MGNRNGALIWSWFEVKVKEKADALAQRVQNVFQLNETSLSSVIHNPSETFIAKQDSYQLIRKKESKNWFKRLKPRKFKDRNSLFETLQNRHSHTLSNDLAEQCAGTQLFSCFKFLLQLWYRFWTLLTKKPSYAITYKLNSFCFYFEDLKTALRTEDGYWC